MLRSMAPDQRSKLVSFSLKDVLKAFAVDDELGCLKEE